MIRAVSPSVSLSGTLFALVALLFGGAAYIGFRSQMSAPEITAVNLDLLPYQLGQWRGADSAGLTALARDILQLDHALMRTYRRDDGSTIDLYIGYWQRQSGEHQAAKHSPAVCLPSNGWNTWGRKTKQLSSPTPTASLPLLAVNSLAGQFGQQNSLFYYWFFSGDRSYANEWTALFFITLEKFLKNRSDGGIVELSTPVGAAADALKQADARLGDFAGVLHPALMSIISANDSVPGSEQPGKTH
jgi:EpsI family protein